MCPHLSNSMLMRWQKALRSALFPFLKEAFLSNDRGSYKKVHANSEPGENTQHKFGHLIKRWVEQKSCDLQHDICGQQTS